MIVLLVMFLRLVAAAAPSQSAACPPDALRYTVLVEEGIPEPSFAPDVDSILLAPDGWGSAGLGELCRDDASPNFAVLLAWPDTVDEMCDPMITRGDVSCSRNGRAVINWKRWLNGSSGWATVAEYRHYVVTHEVGHVLGMGHRRCPEDPEAPTPVMRQQTSRRHASCPRNPRPTAGEIGAMAARLKWSFAKMRRRSVPEPWERPPPSD